MNSENKVRSLVNEAVLSALKEYDGGDGDYGGYDGGGGYGGSVSTSSVSDILFNPLRDIANTAKWGVKTLGTAAVGAVAKTAAGLLALVPGGNYPKVYNILDKWEKQGKGFFNKQYGKALSNNWAALASTDVVGLAALANPGLFFGAKILATVPGVTVDLLDVFSGGQASIRLGQTLSSFQKGAQSFTSFNVPDGGSVDTSYLEEQEQQTISDEEATKVAKQALADPKKKGEVAKVLASLLKTDKVVQQAKEKALEGMKTLPQEATSMLQRSVAAQKPQTQQPPRSSQLPANRSGRPLPGARNTQTT
jgi:hypothetical protein